MKVSPDTYELLAAWAARTANEVDAVLLSDYGKGVLTDGLAARAIEAARRAGRPVVVDPKGIDASRLDDATPQPIVPNERVKSETWVTTLINVVDAIRRCEIDINNGLSDVTGKTVLGASIINSVVFQGAIEGRLR